MRVRDAAVHVLQEAGEPLHVKEITERILAKELWSTAGKTPAATVAAQLYTDIKKNGDRSPFVLAAPQTFGLRALGINPTPEPAAEKKPDSKASFQTGTYSFTDAAEKVLEQFGDKRPMHYRAITEKALEMGWLATKGKTPEATMYAQIITEIKRCKKRGEQPRFVQHGKG